MNEKKNNPKKMEKRNRQPHSEPPRQKRMLKESKKRKPFFILMIVVLLLAVLYLLGFLGYEFVGKAITPPILSTTDCYVENGNQICLESTNEKGIVIKANLQNLIKTGSVYFELVSETVGLDICTALDDLMFSVKSPLWTEFSDLSCENNKLLFAAATLDDSTFTQGEFVVAELEPELGNLPEINLRLNPIDVYDAASGTDLFSDSHLFNLKVGGCISSDEVCDSLDNDCDGEIDELTTAYDCGNDFACLLEKASTCTPAKASTGKTEVDGNLTITYQEFYRIKGLRGDKCSYFYKNDDVEFSLSAEYLNILRADPNFDAAAEQEIIRGLGYFADLIESVGTTCSSSLEIMTGIMSANNSDPFELDGDICHASIVTENYDQYSGFICEDDQNCGQFNNSCSSDKNCDNGICVERDIVVTADGQPADTRSEGSGGGRSRCTPKWSCTPWSYCDASLKQTSRCFDLNRCQSGKLVKTEERECDQCAESWVCSLWSECQNNVQLRSCADEHKCGTTFVKPWLQKSCQQTVVSGPAPKKISPQMLPPAVKPASAPAKVVEQQPQSLWDQYAAYFIGIPSVLVFLIVLTIVIVYFAKHKGVATGTEGGAEDNLDELKDWIKKERAAGASDTEIRNIIAERTDWGDEEVRKAFSGLNSVQQKGNNGQV